MVGFTVAGKRKHQTARHTPLQGHGGICSIGSAGVRIKGGGEPVDPMGELLLLLLLFWRISPFAQLFAPLLFVLCSLSPLQ
jgi:hypothetical protein